MFVLTFLRAGNFAFAHPRILDANPMHSSSAALVSESPDRLQAFSRATFSGEGPKRPVWLQGKGSQLLEGGGGVYPQCDGNVQIAALTKASSCAACALGGNVSDEKNCSACCSLSLEKSSKGVQDLYCDFSRDKSCCLRIVKPFVRTGGDYKASLEPIKAGAFNSSDECSLANLIEAPECIPCAVGLGNGGYDRLECRDSGIVMPPYSAGSDADYGEDFLQCADGTAEKNSSPVDSSISDGDFDDDDETVTDKDDRNFAPVVGGIAGGVIILLVCFGFGYLGRSQRRKAMTTAKSTEAQEAGTINSQALSGTDASVSANEAILKNQAGPTELSVLGGAGTGSALEQGGTSRTNEVSEVAPTSTARI